MVQLLTKYIHQIRFKIDSDSPKEYTDKFCKLRDDIEGGDNQHISLQIKDNCKLDVNKYLPILNKTEGGLGGSNNRMNKQIRYRANFKTYLDNKSDIIFDVYNSDIDKWTYEELDDIVLAFLKVCNFYMGTECVNGSIELINYDSLSDYYFDD